KQTDKTATNNKLDSLLREVCTSFDMSDYHHNAYLASNWNRLDALVVCLAVIGVGFPQISFLRSLRAFRPFRIMVRIDQIKVVLGALMRAIPAMLTTMAFCILFWFVLAIMGMGWWSDRFNVCMPPSSSSVAPEIAITYNKQECLAQHLHWRATTFNFDNVFQALHTLFILATRSNWNEIMFEAVDSSGKDRPPKFDHHPVSALYFIIVIILCSFFSLNLIVSILVDNFNRIKSEKDGSAFQTDAQREWVKNNSLLRRIALQRTSTPPKHKIRKLCFLVVEHDKFEQMIITLIICNVITMACEHYQQSAQLTF
ncbi:sodium channel protein type 11 subunit alpha, partial [Reticulomyxa filosa]